jgi:hypothetical protein
MVLNGFYLTNEKGQLAAAKDKAVGLFKARCVTATESVVPTLKQFRYFF